MSLYEQWKSIAAAERKPAEYDEFWKNYLLAEQKNYEYILEHHEEAVSGKLSEVSEKMEMETVTFTGFIDGINSSLVEEVDLDNLTEESDITLKVDFEKLYYNMLDAKAEWLYNLPQWDDVLPQERRSEITKEFKQSKIAVSNKIGRNDPCPCGSGKKYKKCCGSQPT